MVGRDALPYESMHTLGRASRSIPVHGPELSDRRVAIEALRPMGIPAYGMIGGRFEISTGDSLALCICCPDEEIVFESRLVDRTDGSIRRGLPEEYHAAVLDSAERFCRDEAASPGVLRITCAAHCVYGSSPLAFSGLTRALLSILHAPDTEALATIVREPWNMPSKP